MRLKALVFLTVFSFAGLAQANDFDLDDDSDATPKIPAPPPPIQTIPSRIYSLAECLALADRNHPSIWAARARLAHAHGLLNEAKWTPYWGFYTQFGFGLLPSIGGTSYYNSAPLELRQLPFFGSSSSPALRWDISGSLPLYTFGKIENALKSAEANVRLNEWDAEKVRQTTRMDVRRAYFGVKLARDSRYLADEVVEKLEKAIKSVKKRLDAEEEGIDEIEKIRLEMFKDEILARRGETLRGERFGLAALRFMTGVQTNFDIENTPLSRPKVPVGPLVQYLSAARLFRPEVNMARAGIAARRAQLDFQRSRLFPDIGLSLSASYAYAPSAVRQNTAWIGDPFNGFGYAPAVGVRWNLDLLPQSARISQAESLLEEARSMMRLAAGGIAVEVENQYGIVLEAKTREEAWSRIEHRTKGWLSIVQDRIDMGTSDERALTEPYRLYMNARVNHATSLMDYNIAVSELARLTGWDALAPADD
ncbi:MAG: TolC family protein [Polyangiaceae bacterium]